ncbi:hypothetical protein [Rhodospirillaceae bacterium SYSU D60014]|uniref:hypothetical protein n=1 Tax=Virgifigura deserti TaxID=2268457 RepID=UPI0013C450FA
MRRQMQAALSSNRERVPALVYADQEFAAWRKVKGAKFISAIALLFWGLLFLIIFA